MKQQTKFFLLGVILLLGLFMVWQGHQIFQPKGIPVLLDTDLDGFPDKREAQAGTNPNLPDTDWDSLNDYVEIVKYKTNPLKQIRMMMVFWTPTGMKGGNTPIVFSL
jgi:hypothetical protein